MSSATDSEASPWTVGVVDIVVLAGLFLGGVYWMFFRKKKEEPFKFPIKPTVIPTKQADDTSFVSKMKKTGRSLVIFYGSQTGTAEEFANRLNKEAHRYGLKSMVCDPEECEMEELTQLSSIENSMAVFCMATYGEGDPTDNAQEFCDWLQNGGVDLSGLNYAVFGLGNKTYEHYNETGKFVDRKLEELGATRVHTLGLGDDDANMEEDFITWKEKFWEAVCEKFGLEASADDVSIRQYRLVLQSDAPKDKIYTGEVARIRSYITQRPPFDAKNPYLSAITAHRELHKTEERPCMHLELDITGSRIRYEAGDHVAIYPTNNLAAVEKLAQLSDGKYSLDDVFSLVAVEEDASKKFPFPCPCSFRTALSHYVDIAGLPRTHILKELSEYCSDEKDKAHLKSMAMPTVEGKELYNRWIVNDCRNIVHVLEDTPSCRPPLDHLCELLPRLQPRYYSISSSPKMHPTSIHVTAVLVEYDTPTGRNVRGVATSWLLQKRGAVLESVQVKAAELESASGGGSNMANGDAVHAQAAAATTATAGDANGGATAGPPAVKIPVFVRKSQFRLPSRPTTAVIMIGPGTGVAPFRGFLQERMYYKKEGKEVGPTLLYFGCRKRSEDFLYEEELLEMEKDGLLELYCAFSRDQPHKVYVQHLLVQTGARVWELLKDGAHLYVCGDAKNMARDVHSAVMSICQEHGGMKESEAAAFIKAMEAQRKYSSDVWS